MWLTTARRLGQLAKSPPSPIVPLLSTNSRSRFVHNTNDGKAATDLATDVLSDAPPLSAETPSSRAVQAPNYERTWSRSQQSREKAMSGPRFEQTHMHLQPQPEAAIGLIHEQPVRWTSDRIVSCDGGGGALGHPRIFINVDKPQICACTYCGLPFANEHHREALETQPSTPYPLSPPS